MTPAPRASIFLALLAALAAPPSLATERNANASAPQLASTPGGQVWLNLGGFSRHFARGKGYNESNVGIGVEIKASETYALSVGAYRNSVRQETFYAAVHLQPLHLGPARLGVMLGVLDGYPARQRGGAFFAAVPFASIEGSRYGVNIGLIPSIGKVDGALLAQLKLRLH